MRSVYDYAFNQTNENNFDSIETEIMLVKLLLIIISVQLTFANSKFDKNVLKTWKNNTFYGFRGIKYAEAPVGPLRFKVSLRKLNFSTKTISHLQNLKYKCLMCTLILGSSTCENME